MVSDQSAIESYTREVLSPSWRRRRRWCIWERRRAGREGSSKLTVHLHRRDFRKRAWSRRRDYAICIHDRASSSVWFGAAEADQARDAGFGVDLCEFFFRDLPIITHRYRVFGRLCQGGHFVIDDRAMRFIWFHDLFPPPSNMALVRLTLCCLWKINKRWLDPPSALGSCESWWCDCWRCWPPLYINIYTNKTSQLQHSPQWKPVSFE